MGSAVPAKNERVREMKTYKSEADFLAAAKDWMGVEPTGFVRDDFMSLPTDPRAPALSPFIDKAYRRASALVSRANDGKPTATFNVFGAFVNYTFLVAYH